ncbi:hypothetical protein F511_35799 [Dorcoceras hygrometricum]|uniref:Uncharacterized protein n=1 Tax=Dorcoceras hygrometricum TaxID=472368 RepID=A0A2Z7B862_9LAMI|nr:hypothetical protein F511_35799 [Dorcoceras hygrometricum]
MMTSAVMSSQSADEETSWSVKMMKSAVTSSFNRKRFAFAMKFSRWFLQRWIQQKCKDKDSADAIWRLAIAKRCRLHKLVRQRFAFAMKFSRWFLQRWIQQKCKDKDSADAIWRLAIAKRCRLHKLRRPTSLLPSAAALRPLPPPTAAVPPPRDRTCFDHHDEEIPFVLNSAGFPVKLVEARRLDASKVTIDKRPMNGLLISFNVLNVSRGKNFNFRCALGKRDPDPPLSPIVVILDTIEKTSDIPMPRICILALLVAIENLRIHPLKPRYHNVHPLYRGQQNLNLPLLITATTSTTRSTTPILILSLRLLKLPLTSSSTSRRHLRRH